MTTFASNINDFVCKTNICLINVMKNTWLFSVNFNQYNVVLKFSQVKLLHVRIQFLDVKVENFTL